MGVAPFALPRPEVLLAAWAVAIAVLVGMAVTCFELDLSEARFGWRQVAIGIAADRGPGGRSGVDGERRGRTVGQPRRAGDGPPGAVRSRTTRSGTARCGWVNPTSFRWRAGPSSPNWSGGSSMPARPPVRDRFVDEDAATQHHRGGAGRGVRREHPAVRPAAPGVGCPIVVIPLPDGSDRIPAELAAVVGQLDQQLDLERLNVTSSMIVYRNSAWVPVVASVPADALASDRSFDAALAFPTDEAEARLADDERAGSVRFDGETETADEALLVGFGAGGILGAHGRRHDGAARSSLRVGQQLPPRWCGQRRRRVSPPDPRPALRRRGGPAARPPGPRDRGVARRQAGPSAAVAGGNETAEPHPGLGRRRTRRCTRP